MVWFSFLLKIDALMYFQHIVGEKNKWLQSSLTWGVLTNLGRGFSEECRPFWHHKGLIPRALCFNIHSLKSESSKRRGKKSIFFISGEFTHRLETHTALLLENNGKANFKSYGTFEMRIWTCLYPRICPLRSRFKHKTIGPGMWIFLIHQTHQKKMFSHRVNIFMARAPLFWLSGHSHTMHWMVGQGLELGQGVG